MSKASFEVIPHLKKKTIYAMLQQGSRIDGRKLTEYRQIAIEAGIVERANGSALVKLGNTMVIAGIKAGIGAPFPDTPDAGALMVNVEFVPFASPTFEPGPPDENAIEVARVVDRGLRSTGAVNLEKLCIVPGKHVWVLWCDIYVLNHDGNLIDASALAALTALLNTKLPKVTVEGGEVKIDERTLEPLPVEHYPVTVTMAKIGDHIVVDPCLDEELVMDARLSIAVNEEGKVCAIQKGLGGYFTIEEVHKAIDMAVQVSNELRNKIFEAIKKVGT